MSENEGALTCPQCGREQAEKRNFCPFCGYAFPTDATRRPLPPATHTGPPQVGVPGRPPLPQERPAPHPQPPAGPPERPLTTRPLRQRFRFADWRVLFGILGMLDLPVIVVLMALFVVPRVSPPPPSACDLLDVAEFTLVKYQYGLDGELEQDTLFEADTEYVIQDALVVPQGFRLLIHPGARLVFESGAGLDVHGGLYVCGSEKKPVTFTAEKGEPGEWEGIRFFNAEEDSILSHALIQFAGTRALYLENSTPKLLDVKIANGSGFPISSDGNALPDLLGDVDLDDNPFKGIEVRPGTLSEESIKWPNQGLVYVVSGPLEVGANTTLAIESDVAIKFWQMPKSNPPGIWVRGLLKAEGVRFTSVHDSRDEVGGVTYLEAEDPQPGDWAGIAFLESSSKCYVRQSLIQYAGQGQGAVFMQASSPELTDITIADSAWYPLSADADSFPTLQNLTLTDNDPGDALEIRGGSAITGRQERTWQRLGDKTQIVRVIRGQVTVSPEATLTIEPGVVIKFEEKSKLVIQGTLHAADGGGEEKRIVFTSLRDGDYGGDTDKATGPQDTRGWDGIVFDKTDESSLLQNCIVRYGFIALNDAAPRLIDNLILDSETAAIWTTPGSSPVMRGNRLEGNGTNGVAIWKGTIATDQSWSPLGEGNAQLVRVLAGEVTVADGATLSIGPGTIIKANSDGKLKIQGGLWALGQSNQPVILTSLQDDSAGEDTNQQLEEPDAGDWPGIEIGAGADARFDYTIIRYAQHGLLLRGGNVPAIEGWLRVSDGKKALWCDVEAQMPRTFRPEGNEVNETQCPTQ
jgi:hypothetical protein